MTRLAYIISAYKYPEQLVRLVERLNSGTAPSFFIHVDKRTDLRIYGQMRAGLEHLDNVRFLPRHRCEWGSFGHVAASLKGIAALLESGTPYDYVTLLTGQDYPIKTTTHIERYFAEHAGCLYLEYFRLPHAEWQHHGLNRIQAWHLRLFGRHFSLYPRGRWPLRRKFPAGFEPYGGSSYWCLTSKCIEYIYTFVKDNPGFVNFFRFVDVPDELFFQTIILNSSFSPMAVNHNLRYIEWTDNDAASPAVLRLGDLDKLKSSPQLFARKFDMTVDGQVLDEIDRSILGLQ